MCLFIYPQISVKPVLRYWSETFRFKLYVHLERSWLRHLPRKWISTTEMGFTNRNENPIFLKFRMGPQSEIQMGNAENCDIQLWTSFFSVSESPGSVHPPPQHISLTFTLKCWNITKFQKCYKCILCQCESQGSGGGNPWDSDSFLISRPGDYKKWYSVTEAVLTFKIKRFPLHGVRNTETSDTKVQIRVRTLTGETFMSDSPPSPVISNMCI